MARGTFGILGVVLVASALIAAGCAMPSESGSPPLVGSANAADDVSTDADADREVLWVGDVETGDDSQWISVSISGKASVDVVSSTTRSGDYALRLTNWAVDGTHKSGVRMNLQGPFGEDPRNLPDVGYYSAWYYIPFAFEGDSNIFQFKQSDVTDWDGDTPIAHVRRMLWKIGLNHDADDRYDLEIRTRINPETGEWQPDSVQLGMIDADIPVGEWFHLETRYEWGQEEDGRTTIWLNGEEVWDWTGTTWAPNLTCMHRCREFTINHYLGQWQEYVAPGDSWIFVDDAVLATTRTGTAD